MMKMIRLPKWGVYLLLIGFLTIIALYVLFVWQENLYDWQKNRQEEKQLDAGQFIQLADSNKDGRLNYYELANGILALNPQYSCPDTFSLLDYWVSIIQKKYPNLPEPSSLFTDGNMLGPCVIVHFNEMYKPEVQEAYLRARQPQTQYRQPTQLPPPPNLKPINLTEIQNQITQEELNREMLKYLQRVNR